MPNRSAFANSEVERRYHEFWTYGGDRFPLTDSEWQFVTSLIEEAPALAGLEELLHEGYRTIHVGRLMELSREGPIERRVMVAALVAFGTLPNFLWAGCEGRLLEFLPTVGPDNLTALTAALLQLMQDESASAHPVPAIGGAR